MRKRAIALTNPLVVDQLCDAIISKLRSSDCLLSSGAWVRIPPGTPSKLQGTVAFPAANVAQYRSQSPTHPLCCQHDGFDVTTLSDALASYHITPPHLG